MGYTTLIITWFCRFDAWFHTRGTCHNHDSHILFISCMQKYLFYSIFIYYWIVLTLLSVVSYWKYVLLFLLQNLQSYSSFLVNSLKTSQILFASRCQSILYVTSSKSASWQFFDSWSQYCNDISWESPSISFFCPYLICF